MRVIFLRRVRCATVQEALEILETVDVRHDASVGSGYHSMVADASGDCAVVEFDKEDGWMRIYVFFEKYFYLRARV